jgi:hypothetical protein
MILASVNGSGDGAKRYACPARTSQDGARTHDPAAERRAAPLVFWAEYRAAPEGSGARLRPEKRRGARRDYHALKCPGENLDVRGCFPRCEKAPDGPESLTR